MPQRIGYHRILTIPVANVQIGDVLILKHFDSGFKILGDAKHLKVIDFKIALMRADISFRWEEFNIKNIPLWRTVDMNATATYEGGVFDA